MRKKIRYLKRKFYLPRKSYSKTWNIFEGQEKSTRKLLAFLYRMPKKFFQL